MHSSSLIHWKSLDNVRTYSVPLHSSYMPYDEPSFDAFHKALPLGRKTGMARSNIFGKSAMAKGRMESESFESNSVSSLRINTIDRPGGSSMQSFCPIITTYIAQDPTNKYQTSQCSMTEDRVDNSWITSITNNARRRCRSSGMNKPSFKENAQLNYFNDTRQYLEGKSKSFSQNQFTHIRKGPPSLISNSNVYSSHGLANCAKAYISSNSNHNYLQYLWVDEEEDNILNAWDLYFNEGYYTLEDFNSTLHMRLEEKGHYLIEIATKRKVHFLHFIFNTEFRCIELQCLPVSTNLYPASQFTPPPGSETFIVPTVARLPILIFPPNHLSQDLGFGGKHIEPDLAIRESSLPYAVLSSSSFKFGPLYNTVNYKPSNLVFRQDGAVSGSAEILRKRNNAILFNNERQTEYNKIKMAKPWNLSVPFFMSRYRKSLFNG